MNKLPLVRLDCSATEVGDLTPLRGMSLQELYCRHSKVSDLAPLTGMKSLRYLDCLNTPVSDLNPVKDLPLKEVWLDFKLERGTKILKVMKTLEKINGKPASEFWKEVGAKKAEKRDRLEQEVSEPRSAAGRTAGRR